MAATQMQLVDWLDDLSVRFIVNLPNEELASPERICFQVEEAQWFYEDFIRPLHPTLPSLNLRKFCELIFQHCPLLSAHAELAATAYANFLEYKTRVPVRGAIMLNEAMDHVVLVKGWKKGARWSFPRGKINKDENDLDCAVREVYEETGFHLADAGLAKAESEMKYIEVLMREQQLRLYVFRGVPEDTHFEPRTRKEISKIQWYRIGDLPTQRKGVVPGETEQNRFYMVAPFISQLKRWIKEQKQADKAKPRADHYLVPDSEPEIAGQPIVEDRVQSTAAADMARLHALLARGGTAPAQSAAMETQYQDVDALKQLLGLGASLSSTADMAQQDQRKNELLALFKSTTNPHPALSPNTNQTNARALQTPLDQVVQQAAEAHTPHHHHPRQHGMPQGPPPSFGYTSAQIAHAQQHPIHSHPHPVPGQAPLVPNGQFAVHGMAPPPSFGLPPHLVHQQQMNGPPTATTVSAFQGGAFLNPDPVSTQTPPYPNVQGMAVPKAANLPKPKFNHQNHGRRHQKQQQSTGFAHHPNAVIDRSDPFMRKANLAPANPAQPAQTMQSMGSGHAPPKPARMHMPPAPTPPVAQGPTRLPTLEQQVEALNQMMPIPNHQSSLLKLLNRSDGPSQAQPVNLPPVPAELPGDPGTSAHQSGPPRIDSQPRNEAQNKLLDLFKAGPLHASQTLQQSPVEAIHTPENSSGVEDSHVPLTNRRFSARRSYSKGSSSLPQPVLSILQRPVASPQHKTPEVQPPSTPLHTVKNTTPMQAPKPFNPQILKRPAQLESAANAPLPIPAPVETASSEKEVQTREQQIPLPNLLGGPSSAGMSNHGVPARAQPAEGIMIPQGVPQAQAPYPSQGAPIALQMRGQNIEQQNALLGLFNKPPTAQETWAAAQNTAQNGSTSFAPPNHFQRGQHVHPQGLAMDRTPLAEAPAVPAHNPPIDSYKSSHQMAPAHPAGFSNTTFADRRSSASKDRTANLLNLFRASPNTGPSNLSHLDTSVENDIVSPLDANGKSRVGSMSLSGDTRRGSGAVGGPGGEDRRGSGVGGVSGIERRESGLQTPKTPSRDFLLGFLEGVAKGGK